MSEVKEKIISITSVSKFLSEQLEVTNEKVEMSATSIAYCAEKVHRNMDIKRLYYRSNSTPL
jgi:hypothetical protein